jgi:hypothetical protein
MAEARIALRSSWRFLNVEDDRLQQGVKSGAKDNRFLHSEAINQMPPLRIFGNIVLTLLTKAASG